MKIGEKIKQYLDEKRISQTALAIDVKMSLPKLNLALAGKRKLQLEEYEIICGVLNVKIDQFMSPKLPQQNKRG